MVSLTIMSDILERLLRQASRNLRGRGLRVEKDPADSESYFVIGAQGFPLDGPSGTWRFSKLEVIQLSENLSK
jgi:hypothetical protein